MQRYGLTKDLGEKQGHSPTGASKRLDEWKNATFKNEMISEIDVFNLSCRGLNHYPQLRHIPSIKTLESMGSIDIVLGKGG